MRNIIITLLFITPTLMWGQSKTYLDSVNYYFGILLTHERDSISQYRIKHKTGEKILNRATEEKDESKFVNPWKHIDYCIEEPHQYKQFNAHSTTNKENMMFQWVRLMQVIGGIIPRFLLRDYFGIGRILLVTISL